MVEEELNGIDTDDIGNLEDSPKLVFIDEECGNLIVVNDDGKILARRSQTFYSSLYMSSQWQMLQGRIFLQ